MNAETDLLQQTLEKLRESEERFRGAFSAATAGIALVALDGRWLEINRAYCEIVGYTEAELLATDFQSITHPDDLELDLNYRDRLLAGELPRFQIEKRYIHKSGRVVQIDLSVSLVHDAARQPAYFVAIIQDITARKEAEQDREQFFGHSLTPMCVLTYDGHLKSFNPALQSLFGQSAEKLLTEPFINRVHPDDRQRAELEIAILLKGGPRRNIEVRSLCQDGTYKWTAWDAVPRPEKRTYYAIGHDITDRHLAQEALAESKEEVTTLLDSTAEGIYGLDLEGKGTFFNAACLRMLGYDRAEELLGRELHQVIHHTSADGTPLPVEACKIYRALREGREAHATDEALWRRDGTSINIEYWCHPIRKAGRITGCVVSFLDITQRKQSQEELDRFFEHTPNPMVIAGFDGHIRRVNREVLNVGGWSSEDDVKAEPFLNYFHPDDRELVASRLQLLLAGNSTRAFEARSRFQVDSYKWFSWSATSFSDWQVIYATAQDISERKRAEEAITESERFVRSTLDALSAHIAILDETGIILATNRVWREFALANSAMTDVGVGANYLDVCDRATGPYGEEAVDVAVGIRAVIRGEIEDFALEYPCHSPSQKRWFMARVTRFVGDGPVRVVMSHENITTAKLAQEERQKFVSLAENSTDFIGLATLSGEVIYVNPAACELVGLDTPDCWNGASIQDFYTEEGKRVLNDLTLPAVMATGRWKGEIQFRSFRTGQAIDTDSSAFTVRHPTSGEPLCMATVTRDITQRKRVENSLRLNVAAMEAAANGIAITDINGILEWTNHAFARLTGYSAAEASGQDVRILRSGKQTPEFYAQLWETILAGREWHGELVNKRKDGSFYDEEMTITAVRDATGQIAHFVAIKQDITERKNFEEALRESEQRFKAITETIPDIVWMTRPDGWNVYCNQRWSEYTGLPIESSYGYGWSEMFHPDDRQAALEFWQHSAETGAAYENESRLLGADGNYRWFMIRGLPLHDSAGRITNWFGTCSNNDGQKQITAELQAAKAAADAANQAKSEFLANMSHEIRTPMNGIIGFTDLILDTELSGEQQQYVQAVKTSGESLLKIINDILDFSKIEAGRLDLESIDFDLHESLANTVKAMALRAHEKGLELLCDIRPDVPDTLVGDPSRLYQVIINLVGNAVKFTPQGEISVLVETEELTAEHATLHFTVSDTGIGIPPDRLLSILEPFVQADNTMTRKFGGTGLGLTITARLVELMGGRIWLESEEGQGSKFHFTDRFGRRSTPLVKRVPSRRRDLSGLRVLIVDDNAANRRILLGVLGHWRMAAAEADGGVAALAALHAATARNEPFDLILLDVVMPGMDGFQVLEEIRREPVIDRPAILMISSDNQRGAVARCKELGAAAYLIKPVRPSELLIAIENALQDPRQQRLHDWSEAAPPPLPVDPAHRRLRILVTEDNKINQLLAVRTLQKAGHTVAVANNGQEALAALTREAFDLVLMDVQMPVMDGFQATAQIRQQEQQTGQHMPIVAMTAHAIKGDQERCLEAGMDGYVPKPIQVHNLFSVIADVTAGMSQQPDGVTPPGGDPLDEDQAGHTQPALL